jgi:pimeloyl-ACP methyl ester carboxylesterase
LADGAILLACPCDMAAWRADRSARRWSSEDPLHWLDKIPPTSRVVLLTGSADVTTAPALAQAYARRLQALGIAADFELVPGAGHIDLLGAPAVTQAISRLLQP